MQPAAKRQGHPVRTFRHRQHDGTLPVDTCWQDDRGYVLLYLSYTAGVAVGVIYERGGNRYQLGMQRFQRDFMRTSSAPTERVAPSTTEEIR